MKKRNTWFEETFLPSLEARMNNPKYPNQCILSERQQIVCEKYMDEKFCSGINGRDFYIYTYDLGTKHYTMHFAGKYAFLSMRDDSKLFWFIRNIRTEEYIATFKSEKEMQDWIDENVDDYTWRIKGAESVHWTSGTAYEQ